MLRTDQPPVPDEPIIDLVTGYTLNMPLEWQVEPGWQVKHPDLYQHILRQRELRGIVIEDDGLVELPVSRPYDPSRKRTNKPQSTRKPKPLRK